MAGTASLRDVPTLAFMFGITILSLFVVVSIMAFVMASPLVQALALHPKSVDVLLQQDILSDLALSPSAMHMHLFRT